MPAVSATLNEAKRPVVTERSAAETGFRLAFAGSRASSGASSTSLIMKAKATASVLAASTPARPARTSTQSLVFEEFVPGTANVCVPVFVSPVASAVYVPLVGSNQREVVAPRICPISTMTDPPLGR